MTVELAVINGLGIISALFAYYAFSLRESEEDFNQKLAIFLFFMSMVFLNLVMFTIYQYSINSSLSYLTGGVMKTGLLVMVWTTAGMAFVLLGVILYGICMAIWDQYQQYSGKYRGGE